MQKKRKMYLCIPYFRAQKNHLKNLKKKEKKKHKHKSNQNVNKKGSSTEFLSALLKLKPKIPNFLVKSKRAILKWELIQSIFLWKHQVSLEEIKWKTISNFYSQTVQNQSSIYLCNWKCVCALIYHINGNLYVRLCVRTAIFWQELFWDYI